MQQFKAAVGCHPQVTGPISSDDAVASPLVVEVRGRRRGRSRAASWPRGIRGAAGGPEGRMSADRKGFAPAQQCATGARQSVGEWSHGCWATARREDVVERVIRGRSFEARPGRPADPTSPSSQRRTCGTARNRDGLRDEPAATSPGAGLQSVGAERRCGQGEGETSKIAAATVRAGRVPA
jgi:hypothetical protein